MNKEIEIHVEGKEIQVFHNEDLIYEFEGNARDICIIEELLANLDFTIIIIESDDIELED